MACKGNPGALAGATGARTTFKVGALKVDPTLSISDGGLHHVLRLQRLRMRHALNGPLATTIAALAYDGGRR